MDAMRMRFASTSITYNTRTNSTSMKSLNQQ
jgi:hypothetical protein